jgi:phosphoglycerate-specific signal transduction histidine kinase
MARQIAHEIKNPLTPIRISTQFMRRAYEQKPADFERAFKEGTETILRQVDVLKRIASEFSSYGRMQQLHIKPQPVDALVRGIVHPYEQNTSGIRVVYEDGASNARVMADGEAVRKICSNLIENAMEAMGSKGGELRVHCAETTNDGAPAIRITFRDTGPGLSDEVSRRLFEPYFSTKTTGTGLGLAICRTLSRGWCRGGVDVAAGLAPFPLPVVFRVAVFLLFFRALRILRVLLLELRGRLFLRRGRSRFLPGRAIDGFVGPARIVVVRRWQERERCRNGLHATALLVDDGLLVRRKDDLCELL